MKKLAMLAIFFLVSVMITGCKDPESMHEHTFADSWSKNATHHWKSATCEHTSEVSGKAAHSFGEWTTTKESTEEEVGSKERICSVCNYKETAEIAQLLHTHTFADSWTSDATHHWKAATCEHEEGVIEKSAHSFGEWTTTKESTENEVGIKEQVCSVCNYKKTEEIEKNPIGFVLIKAGTFKMGCEIGYRADKIVHEVTITKDFYMSKYEVTQSEYKKYCSYGVNIPSASYGEGAKYPAYFVSWYNALVYCNKRSIAENLTPCYSINGEIDPTKWGAVPTSSNSTWDGVVCDWNANGYRLPTEAEWEYAARAGDCTVTSLTYSGASSYSSLGSYAWNYSNSSSTTHYVGTKKANAFGLYDMSGNVNEWCWNRYTSSYDTIREGGINPTGVSWGMYRVYRGGGWQDDLDDSFAVSSRGNYSPYFSSVNVGLRVVRSAKTTD